VGASLRTWAPYVLGGSLSLAAIVLVVIPMLFDTSLSALLGGAGSGARAAGGRGGADREVSLRTGKPGQKKRD
jgi:hypothetical protein